MPILYKIKRLVLKKNIISVIIQYKKYTILFPDGKGKKKEEK